MTAFDIDTIRADFPILHTEVNGNPLVYLDNAATTQKPKSVLDAITAYYETSNANVHRGVHSLSDSATAQFEHARETIRAYINAPSTQNVIWTRGTTESINLVAQSYARNTLQSRDVILVSALAHHSNIVPWQIVCEQTGAKVIPIPVDATGEIEQARYHELLSQYGSHVKLVAVEHLSNALGTMHPIKQMITDAHAVGAKVLIDGAQAVGHFAPDMQDLDCDFYAFSGHKCFAPTGIGVLYGKTELFETMPPYHGGGEMIERVSFEKTTYNTLPYKFEAGTPNICGSIAFGKAIEYLTSLNQVALQTHEADLLTYAEQKGLAFDGFRQIGTAKKRMGVLSFLLDGTHPADVGFILDKQGVAVRTGKHCAEPIMDQFNLPGTVRASFSFYNTRSDIDALFSGLEKARMMLV